MAYLYSDVRDRLKEISTDPEGRKFFCDPETGDFWAEGRRGEWVRRKSLKELQQLFREKAEAKVPLLRFQSKEVWNNGDSYKRLKLPYRPSAIVAIKRRGDEVETETGGRQNLLDGIYTADTPEARALFQEAEARVEAYWQKQQELADEWGAFWERLVALRIGPAQFDELKAAARAAEKAAAKAAAEEKKEEE